MEFRLLSKRRKESPVVDQKGVVSYVQRHIKAARRYLLPLLFYKAASDIPVAIM